MGKNKYRLLHCACASPIDPALGGVGQAVARQCMAGQGWVGWGRICLVREFSICLVGVGWEWGSGRI